VSSTVSDQGIATHLGVARLAASVTVYITTMACRGGGTFSTYTETGALSGANGDSLDLTGGGTACVANGHALASGQLTVTGGTGRFSAASGTLDETVDHNLVTDTEMVTLTGAVSPPGH
jgi:hypothetical protein